MTLPGALIACLFGGLALGGLRFPLAWAAVAAALWAWAWTARRASLQAIRPWAPWLSWCALSAALSSQPLKALPFLSHWAGLMAFAALFCAALDERLRRRWLQGLWIFAALAGAAALWTGVPSLLAHGSGDGMTGFLPPYYNYTAFVLAAAAASAIAALVHPDAPRGPAKAWLCALIVFLTVLLLVARARGALLALSAVAAWTLARRPRRFCWIGAAAAFAVLALLVTIATKAWLGLGTSFLLKLDRAAAFKRPQIWRSALAVAADHPLLGEGPGNFEAGFLRHNFPSYFRGANYSFQTPYAHSEPLQAAAETGWVGLALFLWAFHKSWNRPKGGSKELAGDAAAAAATAMALQCLVDNMLQMPALAMLLLSALAVAGDSRPVEDSSRSWRMAAIAGLFLSLTAWIPERFAKTVKFYPADASLREDLARAHLAARPPNLPAAAAELEASLRLNPTNAFYPEMLAELAAASGRWEQARAWADEAVELEPNFLNSRLLRAEAWARQGDCRQAGAELAEVLRRRAELAGQGLPIGGSGGYAFEICSFDAARFERVKRLSGETIGSKRP